MTRVWKCCAARRAACECLERLLELGEHQALAGRVTRAELDKILYKHSELGVEGKLGVVLVNLIGSFLWAAPKQGKCNSQTNSIPFSAPV